MSLFRVSKYLKYRWKRKSKSSIHSPFIYAFCQRVLDKRRRFYAFDLLENIREHLLADSTEIEIEDYGAGSKIFKTNKRRVKDIATHSLKQPKYAQLMFRLVNQLQGQNILELGTSLGLTTCYLAKANTKANVFTIEGDSIVASYAMKTAKLARVKNVEFEVGKFEDKLDQVLDRMKEIDLAFIDGHHAKEPTLNYFKKILEYSNDNTVFVFDDINWSQGMQEAWQIIKEHPRTTTTIDLYQLGIVFLRKELSKEHFIIKY